jgi:hypothetical protein
MTDTDMPDVNWGEHVCLEYRGCQRPDHTYRFSPFAAGDLASMVNRALAWTDKTSDRLAIRSARLGHLEWEQIVELGRHPGYPRK